ncbi:hypothetical protein [Bdellovibrio sp. HCB337]|uniref:hypothetical protein n=1 Tax=Bdellovibrio sp. HCB337 TaxID=3394358 RepID=UPI0039A56F77
MKALLVFLTLGLATTSAFAATANDFAGQYSLENETILGKNQQAICSQGLVVAISGKNVNVVSATFDATAELNGQPVKLVDSTKEGQLQVSFANDQLTISLNGLLPEFIAPGTNEYNEVITLEQAAGKLNVRHTFSSNLTPVNADSQCVYTKN